VNTTVVHMTKNFEKFRSYNHVKNVGESYVEDFIASGAPGSPVEVILPPKKLPEGPLCMDPCQSAWFWEIVPTHPFASGQKGHYVCEHLIDID